MNSIHIKNNNSTLIMYMLQHNILIDITNNYFLPMNSIHIKNNNSTLSMYMLQHNILIDITNNYFYL